MDNAIRVSPQFVALKRSQLGIEAHRRVHKVNWHDPKIQKQLGVISDGELARKLGVTPGAVRSKRVNLNIEAWKPPQK